MKIDMISSPTNEHFLENKELSISIYPWANGEGLTISAHQSKEFTNIFHASMTWEQIDTLVAAIALARAS